MKTYKLTASIIAFFIAGTLTAFAQSDLKIPLSNPGQPGVLKLNANFADDIIVRAHSENEVRIVIDGRSDEDEEANAYNHQGLRRISTGGAGLEVRERDNVISIQTSPISDEVELEIFVPARFSVIMQVTHGDVYVEGVTGEHEIKATNGDVEMIDVGGACIVNSVNGDIEVAMKEVFPNAPMSFTGLNGDIEISLPADTKFTGKMKTDYGDVFTNFDIQLDRSSNSKEISNNDGTYTVVVNKWITGTVNGGGPEYLFKTLHGDIEIRKNQ